MISQPWFVIYFLVITGVTSDTIIIGAGLSGLSAASRLIENGYNDIVILEAEDRIGGRIYSVPFADGLIDLGAQWVHGEKDNAIFESFRDYFNFGRPDYEGLDSHFVISNGQFANHEQCARLELLFKEFISTPGQNISLGSLVEQNYKKALQTPSASSIDISNELANQMLAFFKKQTNVFYASESWFDISVLYSNLYSQDCEGHQMLTWKKEGFKRVFDFITKKLPDPSISLDVESKIQLNKEVTNVAWNPSNVNEKITITCADGSSYSADHVIFTASLGVLKARHETLFSPGLPADKIKAIENIAFGAIGKVFLEFEKPFWPLDDNSLLVYSLLWTDEDLLAIKDTDKEWLKDLVAIIRVHSYPNILEAFVAGTKLKDFEGLTDAQLIEDVMWLLEKFLEKPLPRPINLKRTRWMTNKNFLGSYSYLSMDSEKTESKPKDLAEPLFNTKGQLKILFAGEATDEKHSSYSHGAVASGWRAADNLLNNLKS